GKAEEAMNLYVLLFDGSQILNVKRYGPEGPGPEGSIYLAEFTIGTQRFRCIDSPVAHNFTFTPSTSIFVDCDSEEEQLAAFERLSDRGQILMPLDNYGFSRRFAWVSDRFGVSWQLNLP